MEKYDVLKALDSLSNRKEHITLESEPYAFDVQSYEVTDEGKLRVNTSDGQHDFNFSEIDRISNERF